MEPVLIINLESCDSSGGWFKWNSQIGSDEDKQETNRTCGFGCVFWSFYQERGQFCSDAHIRPKMDESVRMSHQNMGQHLQYMVSGQKNSPCILSMKLIWALLTSPSTVQCSFWQHPSLSYSRSCQCNMLSKHASFLKQSDLSLVFDVHFAGRVSLLVGTHGKKKQQPPTSPWNFPIRQEADHQNDLVSRDPVLYPLRCPRPIGCQSNFAIQPSWNSHELPPSRVVIYPKNWEKNVDEWMAYLNIIYFSGKVVSLKKQCLSRNERVERVFVEWFSWII